MPSPAAITIYVFGLSALLLGTMSLLNPESNLSSLELPPEALSAVKANSLAAIAMGIYYTLAAAQENRGFFMASVPMRCLTATVFWNSGGMWRHAAVWEGGGAALTAVALAFDGLKAKGKQSGKGE